MAKRKVKKSTPKSKKRNTGKVKVKGYHVKAHTRKAKK